MERLEANRKLFTIAKMAGKNGGVPIHIYNFNLVCIFFKCYAAVETK